MSISARTRSPVSVRVAAIRFTIVTRLVSGRPRQLALMYENRRCSILFYLLVPGGKWQTVIVSPVASASRWSSHFHRRTLAPLLPPLSAVMSKDRALG